MNPNPKLRVYDGVNVLREALRRDKELFYAYQANIAMSIVDEGHRQHSRDSYKKRHSIANQGAINFLNLFIK